MGTDQQSAISRLQIMMVLLVTRIVNSGGGEVILEQEGCIVITQNYYEHFYVQDYDQ